MAANEEGAKLEVFKATVKPVNVNDLKREFVNFAVVRHGDSEFTIEFCDVDPAAAGDPAKIQEKGVIEAPVKFRLVCAPGFIELLVAALTENLALFKEKERSRE